MGGYINEHRATLSLFSHQNVKMLAATLLLIAGVGKPSHYFAALTEATAAPAESFSSAFGLEARQSAGLGSMFPESCKSQCTVLLDAYAGCHTGDMVTCATLCPVSTSLYRV